jgi:methylated-DNA-[protein]-cysteine S-methyltransferase
MTRKVYTIFLTEAGWTGLIGSSSGICRTTLPEKSRDRVIQSLGLTEDIQESAADYFTDLIQTFMNYYSGLPVQFSVQIDFSGVSCFQKAVYQAAMTIPYGETASYGWIARNIGKPLAARAVGQALGRNPLPIVIPCHRVLAAEGKLGGFGGGLPLKQYLLKLESKK